jgi:DNA-binding SARP family transcriptional activator/Tfp pilus assembly protein PilF
MDGLEFRILGTLEVWRDGTLVPVEAARQRDVLAALLLQANRVVASDRLIEMVWGEDPPATALNTLHTLVRRLRRRLADSPVAAQQVLQTRPPGYRIEVAADQLDLSRFEGLLRRGREALAAGDAARAARLLGDAVALWRGTALADVTAERLLRVERPRLAELYLQAMEQRIEAELRQGRHAEVLGELRTLVGEHPLRERPYRQLMTALHRCGRQAEALETYRTLWRILADELGVEPEPALQQLHQAILRGDPALAPPRPEPAAAVAAGVREWPAPAQLPADVAAFTGRADELVRLDKLLAAARDDPTAAVAIVGAAGVGKTALAVHWAHRVRDRFPDGQLHIDLRGYATVAPLLPIDGLGQFLRALGVPAERVPADPQEAAGLYRTLLADRRVLVVLDNARGPDQVRPLLPGSPGCLALVTSRDRFDGLVARDGAQRLPLDVLAPSEAQILLRRTIGADRLTGDGLAGVGDGGGAVAELARLCGYLPLALRIAAANLSGRRIDVTAYTHQLRAGGELAGLVVTGDEQTAVRSALSLSYDSLPAGARRLFRLLGVAPGVDITVGAAAALAGTGPAEAGLLLERLAAGHLAHEPAPGRYTCHDLLRHYAAELAAAGPAAEPAAALGRLYAWYLAGVENAARLLYPEKLRLPGAAAGDPEWTDPAQALTWLEEERRNLVLAVQHAAAHGPRPAAYRLAAALRGYLHLRRHVTDCEAVARAGAAAADAEQDLAGQAASQLGLADCHHQQHRYAEAIEHYLRAAELGERAGWPAAQATALTHLGAMYGETGALARAVEHFSRALELHRRIGSVDGQAACLSNLGVTCFELGRLDEAAGYFRQALVLDQDAGSRMGQAGTLLNLGEVYTENGELDRAQPALAEALGLFREVGSPIGESQSLTVLAHAHRRAGDHRRALDLAETARVLARDADEHDAYARWCEAIALNALGAVHLDTGRPTLAVTEHQQALRLVREGGNPYPEVQTLLGLAAAQRALDRPDAAAAYAGQALAIARERGYELLEQRAAAVLAGLAGTAVRA